MMAAMMPDTQNSDTLGGGACDVVDVEDDTVVERPGHEDDAGDDGEQDEGVPHGDLR